MSGSRESVVIAAMPQDVLPARRLGASMDSPVVPIEVSRFPDGETKLRIPEAAATTILYGSLYDPDPKFFPLILAASVLRDLGAREIVLVAPYLCYMRQDKAFQRGEPVSQKVMGQTLSPWIDYIVTVEPHLHRTKGLDAIFPNIKATMIPAAPLLSKLLQCEQSHQEALVIGPDREAIEWTRAVAQLCGLSFTTMEKKRHGDRHVRLTLDPEISVEGKKIFLIDDVASTGETLGAAARILKKRGAKEVEALVAHALCGDEDLARLKEAGILQLKSTDTVPHSTNAIHIAPLLAQSIEKEIFDASAH